MARDGEAIENAPTGRTVHTGITYAVMVPGLVPSYEEMDARIEAHYTAAEWQMLGPLGRAWEVAHYRARKLVALHVSDAQAQAAEREARRKGRR